MTTATLPTPAEFLAQPSDPEDDVEEAAPIDPLTSIAESMRALVDLLTPSGEAADLEAGYRELQDQLDQVLTIVKPSTSKLANAIRAVLAPTALICRPADDAPVEEWREYGLLHGLDLTDNLNRSQIRSALGIPQPAVSA